MIELFGMVVDPVCVLHDRLIELWLVRGHEYDRAPPPNDVQQAEDVGSIPRPRHALCTTRQHQTMADRFVITSP